MQFNSPYSKKNISMEEVIKTTDILMETPLYKNLIQKNDELSEHVKMLQCNIRYLENVNEKLQKKVKKLI